MEQQFSTPLRNNHLSNVVNNAIHIPASPLMEKLGYGTGVIVYKLQRSPLSNRSPWALKKLTQKLSSENQCTAKRMRFEADILKNLNHPNIIGFRAFVQNLGEKPCLAMEQCDSCLGELIWNKSEDASTPLRPFKPHSILRMLEDMSKALFYLHEEALILHCDIKSYNILLKNDFEICKLCDFGVSQRLKSDGTAKGNAHYGTVAWYSPELRLKSPLITTKADIYAFGLVIWEMLALDIPFGDNYTSTMEESSLSLEESKENIDEIIDLCSSSESGIDEIQGKSSSKSDQLHESVEQYRPNIPEYPGFDYLPDYSEILHFYNICTLFDYNERPNAKDIVSIVNQMIKENKD